MSSQVLFDLLPLSIPGRGKGSTFADCEYWIQALSSDVASRRLETNAAKSRTVSEALVTTRMIVSAVSEQRGAGGRLCVDVTHSWRLWRGEFAEVVDPDNPTLAEAWSLFRKFRRSGVSHSDCVSYVTISRKRVSAVIGASEGLSTLLRRRPLRGSLDI